MQDRPFVRDMVREAVQALGGKATYPDIKEYILNKWPGVNEDTINAQIIVCTVNQPSRIHYPENQRAREYDERYDFLYTVGRGKVVLYSPDEHGKWGIREDRSGRIEIYQDVDQPDEQERKTAEDTYSFALEKHLQDFLVRNISNIQIAGQNLELYRDKNGRDGREYPTAVGPIDILAVDSDGNFVVLELKVGQGPDRALGQILRYMGWVKQELAGDKNVSGIIVANTIDQRLIYATTVTPNIRLFEYNISFSLDEVTHS